MAGTYIRESADIGIVEVVCDGEAGVGDSADIGL